MYLPGGFDVADCRGQDIWTKGTNGPVLPRVVSRDTAL